MTVEGFVSSDFGHRIAFSGCVIRSTESFRGDSRKRGIMKFKRAVFVLMGMMLLFAAKSSAQQVKTDYDRGANFAQYKTYSWEQVKTKDASGR